MARHIVIIKSNFIMSSWHMYWSPNGNKCSLYCVDIQHSGRAQLVMARIKMQVNTQSKGDRPIWQN